MSETTPTPERVEDPIEEAIRALGWADGCDHLSNDFKETLRLVLSALASARTERDALRKELERIRDDGLTAFPETLARWREVATRQRSVACAALAARAEGRRGGQQVSRSRKKVAKVRCRWCGGWKRHRYPERNDCAGCSRRAARGRLREAGGTTETRGA